MASAAVFETDFRIGWRTQNKPQQSDIRCHTLCLEITRKVFVRLDLLENYYSWGTLPRPTQSSARGYSISLSPNMPMLMDLSTLSLTSLSMWRNTVDNKTPPPKHNTIPETKNYVLEFYSFCLQSISITENYMTTPKCLQSNSIYLANIRGFLFKWFNIDISLDTLSWRHTAVFLIDNV